ncbi:histidine kinase [Isoptericola sp. CG 20/1183]|uniref:histidine kinase n=1 Tax=Isoptericola halotolerans TaxID=300560 RepID=A0ABX5EDY6_9MICO|nr:MULTISPECIES: histidine kinase [Isoptericola]PRZ03089.1 histidine kinase [Isoptericola sp. CG 20/1183]PRZ03343.1 histidine kinase [Isoptericola halotolerans]
MHVPTVPSRLLAGAWLAIAALTVLVVVTAHLDAPDGLLLDVAVGLAALGLCGLLFTRHAVAAALGLAVLAALSPAATPAATAATLQVARSRPLRTALPVAVAGALGHAVQALWHPVPLPLEWWLLCDVAVHAALLGWGAFWQERALVLWSLRDRARRAEAEQEQRVTEARTAERTRIAREMHDTLAHRLSLLAATAGALEYRPDADPVALAAAAGRVRSGVSDALEDLRQVIRLLRADPQDLGHAPTLADVARLVEEARSAGSDVAYDAPPTDVADQVPPGVRRTVFRVVQEGLTNARRHAPSAAVRVDLELADGAARVRVTDDGAGPGTPGVRPRSGTGIGPGSGTGIVGLRERVTLLDGRLDAGARAGGGFVLEAWLPWER